MKAFHGLALETGTPTPTVAACNGERECELILPGGRGAASVLFEAIDEALANVDLSLNGVHCIAFGKGPGAFTGLRVAAAAAQGLGEGIGVGLCAVSSLAALAQDALDRMEAQPNRHDFHVAPCLPAGRGEVYLGWYRIGESGLVTPQADDWLAPAGAGGLPGEARFIAAGGAWKQVPTLHAAHSARILTMVEAAMPRARAVLRLAREEFVQGRTVSPEQAQPVYLRAAV